MMSALPAEGTPEFAVFLESIRILDAWFVDPSRYLSDLHGAFQASLRRHGLVGDGAHARELSVRGAGDEVFARHWLVLDRRSLQNYCVRWNEALVPSAPGFSAAAFWAGLMLPIAAMFNAIGGWARAFIDAFANLPDPAVPTLLRPTRERFRVSNQRSDFMAVAWRP